MLIYIVLENYYSERSVVRAVFDSKQKAIDWIETSAQGMGHIRRSNDRLTSPLSDYELLEWEVK